MLIFCCFHYYIYYIYNYFFMNLSKYNWWQKIKKKMLAKIRLLMTSCIYVYIYISIKLRYALNEWCVCPTVYIFELCSKKYFQINWFRCNSWFATAADDTYHIRIDTALDTILYRKMYIVTSIINSLQICPSLVQQLDDGRC